VYIIDCSDIAKNLIIQDDIKSRMQESSIAKYTKHFLAINNNTALVFLSFDIIPDEEYFVLYEIYVSSEFRGEKVGTFVLKMVENFAQKLGYIKIVLRPSPLDKDTKEEPLIKWYEKCGYCKSTTDNGLYEKSF